MEPKTIEIKEGIPFTANGTVYIPSSTISVNRFIVTEDLADELILLSDKKSTKQVMLQAMAAINTYEPGRAYMLLYNKLALDEKTSRVSHYLLRLCACYINTENENQTEPLTEAMIARKIADWGAEGLDVVPFFLFAITVSNDFLMYYRNRIQAILQESKAIVQSLEETVDFTTTLMESSGQAVH